MEIHQEGLSVDFQMSTICKQRVKWIATKQDFHYTAPCSKLCEPSLEEHVEKVDVDDDVDEGESVADQVGESVPENSFGRLPLVKLMN